MRKDRCYVARHNKPIGVHSIKHPGVITGVYELNAAVSPKALRDSTYVEYAIDETGMIVYPAP